MKPLENNERESERIEGKISNLRPSNQVLVRMYVEARKAAGVGLQSLRQYVAWYEHLDHAVAKDFGEITSQDIIGFIERLRRPHSGRPAYASRTIYFGASALRSLFDWFLRDELRPRSFWDAFRVKAPPPPNPRFPISGEEKRRLLVHCRTQRERVVVSLLAQTGFRRAELCRLRVGSIRFDDAGPGAWVQLVLPDGSAKKRPRMVYIHEDIDQLRDYLEAHPQGDDASAPLIVSQHCRPGDGGLGPNGLSLLLRGLHLRAQTRSITAHLFRHTRATEAGRNNWNESRMRLFFGWSAWSRMPTHYTHLSPEVLREQVLKDAAEAARGHANPKTAPAERFALALAELVGAFARETPQADHISRAMSAADSGSGQEENTGCPPAPNQLAKANKTLNST